MPAERPEPTQIADANGEESMVFARRSQVGTILAELKRRAREVANNGPEPTYASLEAAIPLALLPESIKRLTTILEVPDGEIRLTFGHFNAYERFEPSYAFDLSWDRQESTGVVIDGLHFNLKVERPDIIDEFFPVDSRTVFRSDTRFPYPAGIPVSSIPEADRVAMNQYLAMNFLIRDKEFEIKLLEDLTTIFNQ